MSGAAERNVQGVAWLVVLLGTAAFFAILVGVPSLGLRYVRSATVEEVAHAECKTGTCSMAIGLTRLVVRPEDGPQDLREGQEFATDANSMALVQFADDSVANLSTNSAIVVQQLRRPRYAASERPRLVSYLARPSVPGANASIDIGTTLSDGEYVVDTALGSVTLRNGSRAKLDVDASRLRVQVVEGRARVAGDPSMFDDATAVAVEQDYVTEVRAESPPDPPREALENIVVDGSFETLPSEHWSFRTHVPGEPEGAQAPHEEWARHEVLADGRSVLRIERVDSESHPADVVFEQQLGDVDVSGASYLELRVQLRVLAQSLPLGGERGSELPLMLKLVYEAADGEQFGWTAGFYTTEPSEDDPPGKYVLSEEYSNVKVEQGEWLSFTSPNLLDSQAVGGYEDFGWKRPAKLKRVEIIASGHDYAADVDEVAVWVK
ncbi:MAG: hypothetical protein ACK2UL_06665 [Anaerolineae bacterium]